MNRKYWYLIFATILTIIIWLQLKLLEEQSIVENIPLRVINLPEDLSVNAQNITIPMNISGQGISLSSYRLSDHIIQIDGSGFVLGDNIVELESFIQRFALLFPDLNFSLINEQHSIVLKTETIMQKRVPVVLNFRSDNDKDYFLNANYSLEGYFVTVSGPSNLVQDIEYVYSEMININILRSRRQSIRLESTNENITLIPTVIEPHSVVEMIARRTIPLIPIQFDDSSLSIFPQRVTIIIEGEADLLNSLTADDFVAYIPKINLNGINEAEILLILPENVKVIDISPQRVTINN